MERLLAAEVEATSARRLSGRLRFAHYPLDKRLAGFEFDFQPPIDRAKVAGNVPGIDELLEEADEPAEDENDDD